VKTITVESQKAGVEVEFSISAAEWADCMRRADTRSRQRAGRRHPLLPATLTGLVLAGAGAVILGSAGLRDPLMLSGAALLLAAPVLAGAVAVWLLRRERRALAASRTGFEGKQQWTLDDTGLTVRQAGRHQHIDPSAIRQLERLGDAVLLTVQGGDRLLLPDRAFVGESQQVRFLKSLKQRIGPGVIVTPPGSARSGAK